MIVAPNRFDPITEGNGQPSLRFAAVIEELVDTVNTLVVNTDEYLTTNVVTDRVLDANAAVGTISASPTQAEIENIRDAVLKLSDVVGTLVVDLQKAKVIP